MATQDLTSEIQSKAAATGLPGRWCKEDAAYISAFLISVRPARGNDWNDEPEFWNGRRLIERFALLASRDKTPAFWSLSECADVAAFLHGIEAIDCYCMENDVHADVDAEATSGHHFVIGFLEDSLRAAIADREVRS